MRAKLLLAVGVLLACAAPLSASIQVGDHIKLGDGVGSPGGAFGVYNQADPNVKLFETFCVEITEFINFTSTYAVEGIGSITNKGGKSLNPYTAWLYTAFSNGALSNFNALSMSDMNALQLALWKSIGYSQSDINTYIGASWYNTYDPVLSAKSWDADFAAAVLGGTWGANSLGDVQVMNLRKLGSDGVTYTDYAQDQLVRVPGSGQVVPEATSFIVWCLLTTCGAIVINRRRDLSLGS